MSTFLLNANSVRKTLSPLFSVINASSILPILGSVMIEGKEKLSMTASDLENTITISLSPEHIEGELSFCFSGRSLKQLLNASLSDLISFKVIKDKIRVQNGDFSLLKEIQTIDNFPKSPVLSKYKSMSISGKEAIYRFAKAIKFVSGDNLRPCMTGVCIIDFNGKIYIVATDAHRLYFDAIVNTPPELAGIKLIVPKKGVQIFLQAFSKDDVEIRFDENYIQFIQGIKTLTSRLIDATYPDWPKVLPCNDILFGMQRKNLLAFLKMARIFVNGSTSQINLVINNQGIAISGGDKDFGDDINYKMPIYNCNKDFAPFRFAVNLRFLQEIASLSNDEYCVFSHSGLPTKAMVIDKCCLLMPLMINDLD